ncbi:MAG: putative drug exporter of the superfamily, partial [Acidimicrobiaceae bacterium]|nr:putative drug exporter of the superfamily [Acidimicrobiaceae bacterium]
MRRVATWCYRHRRTVLALWLVALVGTTVVAKAVGAQYSNSFTLPDTESTRALQLLKATAPKQSGDTEQVVVATSGGRTLDDAGVRTGVEAVLAKVAALPHVSDILSPYDPDGAKQISADRSVAFANVTFDGQVQDLPVDLAKTFVNTAKAGGTSGLQVAVAGQLASRATPPSVGGTGIGILAAAIVLFLVFGSLLATALPLISALISLGTAVAVVSLLTHVLNMPQFADQLILLIGLGVGVDYALFIVSRYRQNLLGGQDVEASTVTAVDTSGRAVLFAGIIVCIALLGMFALGVSFLYGLAVAASIGVLFTMVAALTLLPALLGFFGPRVLARRDRRTLGQASGGHQTGRFWSAWTGIIGRRPLVILGASLAVMVLIALPFLSLRLGNSDAGNDPRSSTTRQAYDLLAKGFGPGFNGPLQLTAQVSGPADTATFARG